MLRVSPFSAVRCYALIVLALSLFVNACNDAPSEVGSAIYPDSVNARTISSSDTSILTSSSTVVTRGVVFNAGTLYIGATPTVRAATLIRMTNVPAFLGRLTTTNIDSAYLEMTYQRFVLGDSSIQSNRLSFAVCELNKPFITKDSSGSISASVRWPDLFSAGLTPNPSYVAGDSIASFSGQIPLADTNKSIRMYLNGIGRQMIASWFVKQADSVLRNSIYGLGFIPLSSSSVVRSFSTASITNPTAPLVVLKVFYHDSTSRDSVLIQSGNDVSVADADTLSQPLHLIQSVIQSEARLAFDVSSIPATDAILKAELRLTLDTTKTLSGNIGSPNRISIITRLQKDSSVTNFGASYSSARLPGSDKIIFYNVGQALDQARRSYNGKASFSIVSTGSLLERHAMYGLDAPPDKRPVLIITYASRPNAGGKR